MLNKAAYTDYTLEVAHTLRNKETQRIVCRFQSPELHYRSSLVNYIRFAAEKLKLTNTAVHLAVYLLDIFMDSHGITPERLNLVTIVSVMLAAKIEETDGNIPKISKLNALVGKKYTHTDFICLELMILQFMDWNIVVPTAAHFAEYYAVYAVTPADFNKMTSQFHEILLQYETFQHLKHRCLQCIKEFLDQSLSELSMYRFQPSVVAAACIAAARQRLSLCPRWTYKLRNITDYRICDLQPCINILLGVGKAKSSGYKRKLPESPDHGYESGHSSSSSPGQVSLKRSRYGLSQ